MRIGLQAVKKGVREEIMAESINVSTEKKGG